MKKYNFILILLFFFQSCKAQKKEASNFIYHTADYYESGIIREESIYNSSLGIYEYKQYSDDSLNGIVKNIKIYIRFTQQDLNDINQLHKSLKSEMSDCYFQNNIIVHKSTITFDSLKDNFDSINCANNENSDFIKIENKIEASINSSSIYKTTFYWKFYKK
ncbi:hypothetical protein EG359_16450 [Chryseobacterium joostei]|uniref:Lipoprotein n=1 Tax=Chryseobacterium joostei TaxID=112234 RepID=A0A1N7IA38_9FLAO|nr:hypothetical protein [Chryseobacterium joostei]AZB01109.1 hypothetical protein EG359_16450 [Chryseobacterium joostei]SIS33913.1 hypothetical protein SAMN05421768_103483 [Chryseobacterium joostei]